MPKRTVLQIIALWRKVMKLIIHSITWSNSQKSSQMQNFQRTFENLSSDLKLNEKHFFFHKEDLVQDLPFHIKNQKMTETIQNRVEVWCLRGENKQDQSYNHPCFLFRSNFWTIGQVRKSQIKQMTGIKIWGGHSTWNLQDRYTESSRNLHRDPFRSEFSSGPELSRTLQD